MPLAAEIAERARRRRRLLPARPLPAREPARADARDPATTFRSTPTAGGSTRPRTRSRPPSSTTDIRITTRYSEQRPRGRALLRAARVRARPVRERASTPRSSARRSAGPASLGLHESQSRACGRTWSGAACPFWRHFYPLVAGDLPGPARRRRRRGASTARSTRCSPRLIRTEADELTYDLHIILRFELEQEIFDGNLALRDLPEAWNERVELLSRPRRPERRRRRAPGRALGGGRVRLLPDLLARQRDRRPALAGDARGAARPRRADRAAATSMPLREWLRENVHRHGRKLTARAGRRARDGRPDRGRSLRLLPAARSSATIYSLA